MSSDTLVYVNKCIDAERSKISIKIEAFDIEPRPETVEKYLQTNDSELLGRIHSEIQVKNEPETIEQEISAVEPKIIKIEQEISAVEPEPETIEQEILAVEPKILRVEMEVSAVEPEPETIEQEISAVEPKIIKIEQEISAIEPKTETIEQEISAVEPEPETIEQEISAVEPEPEKIEQEILAVEPKILRVERGISVRQPMIIKVEQETMAREEVIRIDKETEIEDLVESEVEDNPLLKEISEDEPYSDYELSSLSSAEFEINREGFSSLSEKDPKTILTWNVSGLALSKSKKTIWESFLQILKQQDPDIVVLQDVKLCSSEILGKQPKLSARTYGGHVSPSYTQEVQDADLVNELKRTTFKKYYCVYSLSAWRIAGQLVFVKKEFECLKMRYNLNIKANPKYHHPEGRCIILQFNSFYLISLLSPVQGWVNRSVRIRSRWDRELATFLNNSKSKKATIITGCLNCAPQDIDLSDPERLKQEKSIVLHKQEELGFPGSRDVDREGFKWLMDAGNMVDVFRVKHPYDGTEKTEKNIKFTTLAFLSDKTRCAVRTNLVLMSKNFLRNVKFCEIIGNVNDLNPSGWRHLPQLLRLEKK